MIFRGEPIEEAIKRLVRETRIDLIYDPAILDNSQVYTISRDQNAEEILSSILSESRLDYIRLSSGTYVIIRSPENIKQYGSLTGTVVDKESGKPLAGANVMIADASTGTSSNNAGRFSVSPLLTGEYEVTVSYVGYKAVRDTIYIPTNGSNHQRFYMEARPVFVEPIVVSGLQRRLPYSNNGTDVIPNTDRTVSATTGSVDAIKRIRSSMGVQFNLPTADFNLQGGAEGDHRVILDGVPVYNPVSLGRLTGAFSPFALDKVEVYKAGYRASAGSQLSGLVSFKHDLPGENESDALVQADPININGRINISSTFENGVRFKSMAGFRGDLWNWYQFPNLSNTLSSWDRIDPLVTSSLLSPNSNRPSYVRESHQSSLNFYDLHYAAELVYSEFHRTYFSFYRGKNYVQTSLLSGRAQEQLSAPKWMYTRDTYDWLNNSARLEHNWLVTPRLQSMFGISWSRHHANHHFGMASSDDLQQVPAENSLLISSLSGFIDALPHTGDGTEITETLIEAELEYNVSDRYKLKIGLEPKILSYSFELSDLFYHFSSSQNQSVLLAGFLENEYSLSFRTEMTIGSRFTHIPGHSNIFAEPRFSIRTDFPETNLGSITAGLSAGIYRQFINQFDLTNAGPTSIVPSTRFWVPADFTTDVPKAYHIRPEVLVEPSATLSIRFDSFYKWNPTILTPDYHALLDAQNGNGLPFTDQSGFITSGKRYSYGTGVRVEKYFPESLLEVNASYHYSFSKMRINDRFDDQYVRTPWNQPHVVQAGMDWNATSSLSINAEWQSIWGRAWAFRRAYYDYLSVAHSTHQFGMFDFGSPSNDLLSPYHQLDIGLNYRLKLPSLNLLLGVNLINALDRKNELEKRVINGLPDDPRTSENIEYLYLPGFTPSVSLRFTY